MPKVVFPLPDSYFPPLELTDDEQAQFQTWAESLLQQTIDAYHRDQFQTQEQRENRWKPLKQRGGLTAFRRRKGADEDDDGFRYLCTGKIEGTLDEVMLGRYADHTDMFRRVSAVYREDLVDCAVLHVMERQSPAKPFFFSGFKWMTVQSPGKGLVKNRDVCWFEQTGLTIDRNGKEIGYSIAESVDLASCPPFDPSLCVRARLSVCYLFKRNKSGGTKVYMRGKNNAGGKVMDWVADLKSAELWLRVERATACAHALIGAEMVRAAHLNRTTPVDKTGGLIASQKKCAVCCRVTCSRCVVKRRVLSSARDFLSVERESFCKRCMRFFHDINHRDANSIAAACTSAATRGEPQSAYRTPGSQSSYASEYSFADSTDSGDASSFRDTTDSSPEQAFNRHLVGSVPGYPSQTVAPMYYTDNSPVPKRKTYETPEDMMAQMIRMNIMAEQARQLVAENNKFTQQEYSPRP
ncbi:hypothetical protein ATCC90586_009218 [Pythium insidiosum]|nr:hypothetical protein ATCC90586_009218 [Pythium insidiosum]